MRGGLAMGSRRGLTLLEIMVVIAIMMAMLIVAVPSIRAIADLDVRKAAKDLALTYETLHDEAILRNVTFRIAYHLDDNYYVIEEGASDSLIFASPAARQNRDEMIAELKRRADNAHDRERLQQLSGDFGQAGGNFKTKVQLPDNAAFGGVYTPQYGKLMRPGGSRDRDKKDPKVVYSYLFANGQAEYTMVQIVDAKDKKDGYTVQVEPLSGNIRLIPNLKDWRDNFDFVPSEGPDLPN